MDPILVTDRLTLRPLSLDDAEPTLRLMTPAIARWTGTWIGEETSERVADRIERYRESEARGLAVHRVATLTATGELLGWMGVRRCEEAPRRGALGYWIGEAWFGRGLTREAVRALVPHAFEALDLQVVEAAAQTSNIASQAVLRGLGMRHMGQREEFAPVRGTADLCDWFELGRPGDAGAARPRLATTGKPG
jgi:ribosomal-protein-alanine N-acetyltransferase